MSDVMKLIEAGDRDGALDALAAMKPKRRRKLIEPLIAYRKRIHRGEWGKVGGGRHVMIWEEGSDGAREAVTACVCMLATASEMCRPNMPPMWDGDELLRDAQRLRPTWLERDQLLMLVNKDKLPWGATEALVSAGLCERLTTDPMVESMVQHTGFRGDGLTDMLRSCDGLIESGMLYRLFEVEGGQQSSPAAADKYRQDKNQWSTALYELAQAGELDRDKLIDGSLDALARDFATFRAGWFSRFHDRLAPTADEKQARAERYLRLLGSTVPATVSWALAIVEKLQQQSAIDAKALLAQLPPALQARQKGVVKRAAKLLLSTDSPARAIELAIDALAHPAPDVQKKLLDVIDALMPRLDDPAPLVARLAECHPLVAPSLRKRLPKGEAVEEIAFEAADTPSDPFDASYTLKPAPDLDAAIELVSYALEHPLEPEAYELALDAIARHADGSDDWAKRCGPLRKRAKTLTAESRAYFALEGPLAGSLAFAAHGWCEHEEPPWPEIHPNFGVAFRFLFSRVEQLVRQVCRRVALPLLSTPSHRGGWLDIGAFRERLARYKKARAMVGSHDAVLALMRLPAAKRKAARKSLDKLTKAPKRALDLAVAPPKLRYQLWAAAAPGSRWIRMFGAVKPKRTRAAKPLELRRELHDFGKDGDKATRWSEQLTRWRATASPDDLAGYFAHGAVDFGTFDFDETHATAHQLHAFHTASCQLGREGHWLLLLALASRGNGAIDLGMDVAIDGFAAGRVEAQLLAEPLAQLLPSGMLKAKRLAKTFGQIAEASSLHAACVCEAIATGLRGDPAKAPRDVAILLSLLYELLVASDSKLSDLEARDWLTAMDRGGKVKSLKAKILALG